MNPVEEMTSPGFQEKVREIARLLEEAYAHYFATSDGHCKSSEGSVGVILPPFFWREDAVRPSVTVYSYVLGPSRLHTFGDVDEALAAVRRWHRNETQGAE